jgi:hypothetical protein
MDNMKNKLVNEKQLLKEKLSAFEQKANNRFELTEKFLKYNIVLANEGRGAWRILSESGFFLGNSFFASGNVVIFSKSISGSFIRTSYSIPSLPFCQNFILGLLSGCRDTSCSLIIQDALKLKFIEL